MADLNAGHVGDRIQCTGRHSADSDAEVAGAVSPLNRCGYGRRRLREQRQGAELYELPSIESH
jgi:hypothetical protein